jgi:8-oxo-dGTP diphosphatase
MLYYRYTLIFLTRGTDVLMLHRRNPPNQGFWNGVGGRLEPGETPLAGALREVREETGYNLDAIQFRGLLTWEGHSETAGGLYIFSAAVPEGTPAAPRDDEGVLAWKPREWVLSSGEVVSNIPMFAPYVLGDAPAQDYHFVYATGDEIVSWEIRKLVI